MTDFQMIWEIYQRIWAVFKSFEFRTSGCDWKLTIFITPKQHLVLKHIMFLQMHISQISKINLHNLYCIKWNMCVPSMWNMNEITSMFNWNNTCYKGLTPVFDSTTYTVPLLVLYLTFGDSDTVSNTASKVGVKEISPRLLAQRSPIWTASTVFC